MAHLKAMAMSDPELVELVLVIDFTCGYNRYVQGLQADLETKPFGENAEANQAESVKG